MNVPLLVTKVSAEAKIYRMFQFLIQIDFLRTSFPN